MEDLTKNTEVTENVQEETMAALDQLVAELEAKINPKPIAQSPDWVTVGRNGKVDKNQPVTEVIANPSKLAVVVDGKIVPKNAKAAKRAANKLKKKENASPAPSVEVEVAAKESQPPVKVAAAKNAKKPNQPKVSVAPTKTAENVPVAPTKVATKNTSAPAKKTTVPANLLNKTGQPVLVLETAPTKVTTKETAPRKDKNVKKSDNVSILAKIPPKDILCKYAPNCTKPGCPYNHGVLDPNQVVVNNILPIANKVSKKVLTSALANLPQNPTPVVERKSNSQYEIDENGRKVIKIGFVLNGNTINYLQKIMPMITFKWDENATLHPHPVGSLERRFSEQWIVDKIKDKLATNNVVDIGGNPDRHNAAGRKDIWSCCPILDSSDQQRAVNRRAIINTNWCPDKVETCNHIIAKALTDNKRIIFIGIQSIYYLTPDMIMRLLHEPQSNGEAYFTVHKFESAAGTLLNGEANYTVDSKDYMVTMSVNGNSNAYHHSNMSWLKAGFYGNMTQAVSWALEHSIGDTHIYHFFRTNPGLSRPVPAQLIELQECFSRNDMLGEVDLNPIRNVGNRSAEYFKPLMEYNTGLLKADSYFDQICLSFKNNTSIMVPKGAVAEVALKVVGRKRDSDTYRICIDDTKKVLSKMAITPSQRLELTPIIAAMAFTKTVDAEYDIMYDSLYLRQNALNRLNNMLFFRFESIKNKFTFLPKLLLAVVAFVSVLKIGDNLIKRFLNKTGLGRLFGKTRPQPMSMPIYLSVLTLCCFFWRYLSRKSSFKKINFIRHVQGHAEPDVCCKETPLKPLGENAKIIVFDNATDCQPGFGTRLIGFGVATRKPRLPRACHHNAVVALRNRCCFDLAQPDSYNELAWGIKQLCEDVYQHEMIEIKKIKTMPFNEWVSRYPTSQRKRFTEGRISLQRTGARPREFNDVNAFIKRELFMKDGPFSPRLIQAHVAEFVAGFAPWYFPFQKHLASEWNVRNISKYGIIYTSGMNATEVGQSMKAMTEHILAVSAKVVFGFDDKATFDATCKKPALKDEIDFTSKFGITRRAKESMEANLKLKGIVKPGIMYKCKPIRRSGGSNTSGGNTGENARTGRWASVLATLLLRGEDELVEMLSPPKEICEFTDAQIYNHLEKIKTKLQTKENKEKILSAYRYSVRHYVIQALGDDNYDVTTPEYARTAEFRKQLWSRLGFVPKMNMTDNIAHADYCSGLAWPVVDKLSGEHQWVYGPKIGRSLTKAHYLTSKTWDFSPETRAQWIVGVTTGFLHDQSFIPILRVVNDKIMELMRPLAGEYKTLVPEYTPHVDTEKLICDETWDFVHERYGASKADILEIEDEIRKVKQLPVELNHPIINKMVEIDCPIDQSNEPFYEPGNSINLMPMSVGNSFYDLIFHTRQNSFASFLNTFKKWSAKQCLIVLSYLAKLITTLGLKVKQTNFGQSMLRKFIKNFQNAKFPLAFRVMNLANNNAFITTVLMAPILEEWIKKLIPGSVNAIVGIETISAFMSGNVISYLLTAGSLHYICDELPLKTAISVHMIYNLAVFMASGVMVT